MTETKNSKSDRSNWVIAILTAIYVLSFIYFTWRPFDKDIIEVKCANDLFLKHDWGNIIFDQFFHIRNSGQLQGNITKIEGLIKGVDEEKYKRKIKAINYNYVGYNSSYPFLEILLNPNELYDIFFSFYKEACKENLDTIAYYKSKIYDEIIKIRSNSKYIDLARLPIEISDSSFKKIKKFIYKSGLEDIKEGSYEYIVQIWKNNENSPFFTKCYSFEIYNIQIEQLKESVKDYKRGNFFYSEPLSSPNYFIKVKLSEIVKTDERYKHLVDECNK
ncbi:MAG: hypothetical protein A2033_04380 [Bacteroidetes bacterium GWA2_31_9]|nr:MAG: hypothetical protein A2033_04380 [Bacteroidetes bacterium GWA2_31_9]